MKYIIIFVSLLLVFQNSFSQKQVVSSGGYTAVPNDPRNVLINQVVTDKNEPCGTLSAVDYLRENPGDQPIYQRNVEEVANLALNDEFSSCFPDELTRFIIPVLVHVVSFKNDEVIEPGDSDFPPPTENEMRTYINDMLTVLDDDFNGATLRESTNGAVLPFISGSFDKNIGVTSFPESSISFRLAEKDPLGNATSGINFIDLDYDGPDGINGGTICDLTGVVDFYSPEKYLNIFIVDRINAGVHGYAKNLFTIAEPCQDAVVLPNHVVFEEDNTEYKHFPSHEVGHWLGLEHVWGPNPPDCQKDDFHKMKEEVDDDICTDAQIDELFNDTPVSNEKYDDEHSCVGTSLCPVPANSSHPYDMMDNLMNYGHCRTTFSKGQIRLMEATLKSSIMNRCNLHSLLNLESVFHCITPLPGDINYTLNPIISDGTISIPGIKSISINAPNYENDVVAFFYKKYDEPDSEYKLITFIGDTDESDNEFESCTLYNIKMAFICDNNNIVSIHYADRVVFYGNSECSIGKKATASSIEKKDQSINLYPNPTEGIFTVTVDDTEKVANFSLTDITGRKANLINIQKAQNTLEFDASNLDAGYYILTIIYTNGERASSKLIIN